MSMDGNAGCYALWARRDKGGSIVIGAKGDQYLPPGDYLYFGRASKGLKKRLARHARQDKALFWHIDYLLYDRHSELLRSFVLSPEADDECRAASVGLGLPDGEPVPGFGNSDCKNGCVSHLVYFPRSLAEREIKNLVINRL